MQKRNIGILLFDDVEVLDFAGPFEVFAITSELHNHELANVFTVSKNTMPILAVNGLSVNPTFGFNNCPALDILIIPGGEGTRKLMDDAEVLDWVLKNFSNSELILTICSGSLLLAKLGLLNDKPYCTHHEIYDLMTQLVPSGIPQYHKRYTHVDNVYTSGGISAGIDLSFHVIEKLYGSEKADQTATYMEYNYIRSDEWSAKQEQLVPLV